MKLLNIPDIHGKEIWKKAIAHNDWDHVVFLGDFTDNKYIHDYEIVSNLKDIIKYKKENYDKTTLLWSNHDLQYLYPDIHHYRTSDFRESYANELYKIFIENKNMFRYIKQINSFIFTHAGIHKSWWDSTLHTRELLKIQNLPLVDQINLLATTEHEYILSEIGIERGGRQPVGGPIWSDWNEFKSRYDLIPGFKQIVGHSKVGKVIQKMGKEHFLLNIWYTDCLDTINQFLYIENNQVETFTL